MVKLRNRYRLSRVWLSFSALLLGILAGYFVGRESILHAMQVRIGEYADRLLQQEEDVGHELTATLKQANASTYAACSEEDIALLRRLTFAARFLKDVGRLHDGALVCSATSGKLPAPAALMAPDLVFNDGHRLYRSYPLGVPTGENAQAVSHANAEVVLGPNIFSDFPQRPIPYAVGVIDPATLAGSRPAKSQITLLPGMFETASVPAQALGQKKVVRVDDTLYAARCSSHFPVCAVTHLQLAEVWQMNITLFYGYIATGGTAGSLCALMILFAGQKRRTHSNQLKRAILMGKLSVAYQPIVELGTHRIMGAEALARWTDEDGDSIRPETILALAEAEGFVSEITRFVVTRSLDELKAIFEANPSFRLNINLAPSDLIDPRLLLLIDEKLQGSSTSPQNLAFELTERATSEREVAVSAIRRLRRRGHSVFIDDFGTGYSNLAYLTELDVDGIKISRSFIATLGTDSVTASIVPQILAVAHALNLKVVVQGIERAEQATYFSVDDPLILGQGWFFGQPIPARSLLYLCAEKSE